MRLSLLLVFAGVVVGCGLTGAASTLPPLAPERWVADGVARFDRSRMLRLVAGATRRRHVPTLVTRDPGVRAFAFTFGP